MPIGKYTRKIRPALFVIGPSIAYIQLTQEQVSLVDWDDAIWMQAYSWFAIWAKNTQSFYAARTEIKMHREITGCPEGLKPDHINRNTLDNRRCNLRIANNHQNGCNSGISSRNNSGVKGVHWSEGHKKWAVYISIDGKNTYIGRYVDRDMAIQVRKEAIRKYHGEFAED